MAKWKCPALVILAAVLLSACSGTKPYHLNEPRNLTVRTTIDTTRADLHLYRVKADCSGEYLGTVELPNGNTRLGLPAGLAYLRFSFTSSSFFSTNIVTEETLLRVRSGEQYQADVSYRENMYDVSLNRLPKDQSAQTIPLQPFSACTPG